MTIDFSNSSAILATVKSILEAEELASLRFNSFSWAYWHAMCAPVHMAAGHFGAAIEALQNAYMKAHPAKLDKTLITDKAKWTPLKEAFLKAIAEAGLEPAVSTILTNKVTSNLNRTPPSVLSEKMLAEIGIILGRVETAAWKRRNVAAHGGEIDLDSVVPTIMETKLLKMILHRIVLKITGASDRYYDDYTIGHVIRNVTEPVPSPPLRQGQRHERCGNRACAGDSGDGEAPRRRILPTDWEAVGRHRGGC